jgi:hypothetical protein
MPNLLLNCQFYRLTQVISLLLLHDSAAALPLMLIECRGLRCFTDILCRVRPL